MEDFVDSCPQNITAVLESSTRLGCGQDKYGNNQYICVPNIEKTGLIELCYSGIMGIIQRGNCLRTTGGQLYRTSCLGFSSGCPNEEYRSNKIYKYPACQSINTQHSCYFAESSCPNSTEDITTRGSPEISIGLSTNISIYNTTTINLQESTPPHNYTAVVAGSLTAVVFIIVLLVLAYVLWKKKCRKKKREQELTSKDEGEMFLPEYGIETSGTVKVHETDMNIGQEERMHDATETGVFDSCSESDAARMVYINGEGESQNVPENQFSMSISPEEMVSKLTYILEKIRGLLLMKEYDEDLRHELSRKLPNYMTILENRKRDITKKDSSIVIAGEASAGKTTLINSLLGEKIFATSNVASTGKIIRIRDSETLACKYYTRQGKLKTEQNARDLRELKKLIRKGFDSGSMSEEDHNDIYYVDVLLPFPILKGNVIIVETPGIAESEELDKILLEFLPNAVSFIFVLNARNSVKFKEDSLLRILRSISANLEKMPCFNPKEALFVTNQWDIVEDDSDEEDGIEGAKERTLRIIKEKLTRGWIEVDEEKIFRVSLKKVVSKTENEYSGEYKRLREFLKRNIKRNDHNRLRNHFRFLETLMQYAETGIMARLNYLSKSEEEKQRKIEKLTAKIDAKESECREKRDAFVEDLNCKLDHLAYEFWNYLNSSRGRSEILNPDGSIKIDNVPFFKLNSEIPERIQEGIKRWCAGKECRTIVDDAQNSVQTFIAAMKDWFLETRADIIGVNVSDIAYDFAGMAAVVFSFPFSAEIISFAAMLSILFLPSLLSFGFLINAESHRKRVDEIFDACIDKMNREYLREKFAYSFGSEYKKIIQKIFDEDIPNEICSLRLTLEKHVLEQHPLKDKEDSLRTLQKEVRNIRQEMAEIRAILSEIIDE